METLINVLVNLLCSILYFYGVWLLLDTTSLPNDIESIYRNYRRKRKIKRLHELSDVTKVERDRSAWYLHIEMLINSMDKEGNKSPYNFIILQALIGVMTFYVLIINLEDLVLTSAITVFFAFIPYLYLRFRLASRRMKLQSIFLEEFHKIVQTYQSTGRDMYYTILNVSKDTDDKELKVIYMKLVSSFQKRRGSKDFRKAVEVFTYSINSNTAKRFSKLLIRAQIDRADVTKGLKGLSEEINKRRQDLEVEKTRKTETLILGYLPAILLPIMVFGSYKVSSVRDYWFFFMQKLPFTVFVFCIVLSVISFLLAYLYSKPRADI